MEYKKIKIGKGCIEAIALPLGAKNLVLLRGARGYIMCGYLNISAARKFKDVAVKITGVSTVKEALSAHVHSRTPRAGGLGIYKGQPVKEVLKIIA